MLLASVRRLPAAAINRPDGSDRPFPVTRGYSKLPLSAPDKTPFGARIQSSADEPCWAERRPLN